MPTKHCKRPAVQNLNTAARDIKELRSQLSTCTGKICAYRDVGKEDEAARWGRQLVATLSVNNLIPGLMIAE